jgi:hypothetical protein
MNYQEAIEKSLKVKWIVSHCDQHDKCWCRVIKPEIPIFFDEIEELWISRPGELRKEHAEYIVNLHNQSL